MGKGPAARVAILLTIAMLGVGCITITTPGVSPTVTLNLSATVPLATATAVPGLTPAPDTTALPTAAPSPTRKPRRSREPPTVEPTTAPTTAPTAEATPTPTPAPTLDQFSNTSRYGHVFLNSGLFQDPVTVDAASGGPVDARYVGRECSGFAAIAPDYLVGYQQPFPPRAPSSLLRFYFVGPRDTTLILGRADRGTDLAYIRWFCADDSFGTHNPAFDFHDPATALYYVWIGSAEPGDYVAGTLYVTENDANHP